MTLTTNGQYIYFRVVNNAGTKGNWSTCYKLYVDTTTPTVTINSSLPSSVTKGDSYTILGSYTANGLSGGSASCSSNLDGTVTNTSSLTTVGTHTITCTATTGAGKTATVTKTVKITYTKYTVTNLIGDSSFENNGNGWSSLNGTIVSTTANSGSKSLYCNDISSSSASCWNRYPVTIEENHKVYMSAAIRYVSGDAAGGMSVSYDGVGVGSLAFETTTKNKFIKETIIKTTNGAANLFQIGSSLSNIGTSYYDDILVIDLTATFGAGNEPDLTWCNKHIEYFDGSKTIYK